MARTTSFDPSSNISDKDSLLITLFIAAIVHIMVILGVNFTLPRPPKASHSIDITLIDSPALKAPKIAKHLAQDNQTGAGEQAKKLQPPPKKIAHQGNSEVKELVENTIEQSQPKTDTKRLTQQRAEKKIETAAKSDILNQQEAELRPRITAETLQEQITQLGTEIRLNQQSAEQSKIKFVDQVSAHKFVAAQYIQDWQRKVERTGNMNYPQEAVKKNFSASLTMDVGINIDGSIYSLRISKSSGNAALDEAAKRIVRLSEPFPPLPLDLTKELKVLVISRTWSFADRSGMTAH
ncbi:energy transducer TonB [Methylosoma difficile]